MPGGRPPWFLPSRGPETARGDGLRCGLPGDGRRPPSQPCRDPAPRGAKGLDAFLAKSTRAYVPFQPVSVGRYTGPLVGPCLTGAAWAGATAPTVMMPANSVAASHLVAVLCSLIWGPRLSGGLRGYPRMTSFPNRQPRGPQIALA